MTPPNPSDAPLPDPVILIPGITATNLRDEYPIQPQTVFSILRKEYARIALHPADLRWELQEPARVRSDHAFPFPYGDLIEELRHTLTKFADRPVPVFAFAYDWRQPLERTEAILADFVDEVIGRTKLLQHYAAKGYGSTRPARVGLVGHSMGGLVIAGYLEKHGATKVSRVATIGSPFRGSQEAPRKVITGEGEVGVVPSRPREREAARATPALYHLLPSYDGAAREVGAGPVDLYDPESWQSGPRETLKELFRLYGPNPEAPEAQAESAFATLLAQARAHRDRLEAFRFPQGFPPESWLAIVGVGEATWLRLRVRRVDGKPRFDFSSTGGTPRVRSPKGYEGAGSKRDPDTGDGTVPFYGAEAAFLDNERMVCVTDDDFGIWELRDRAAEGLGGLHATLPAMNLVQRLVISHFQGWKEGNVWGRPAPGVTKARWNPPIDGLKAK